MFTPVRVLFGIVGAIALWYGLKSLGVIGGSSNMVGPLPAPAGTPNAALIQQQAFTSPWQVTNGDLHLTTPSWSNNSNAAIQSADLECDQYDPNNADKAQQHIRLTVSNGSPLPGGDSDQFSDLDIGKAVQNLSKVNCGIMAVTLPQGTTAQ